MSVQLYIYIYIYIYILYFNTLLFQFGIETNNDGRENENNDIVELPYINLFISFFLSLTGIFFSFLSIFTSFSHRLLLYFFLYFLL